MIDKLSILGGGSIVKFGGGKMVAPIRILVNGRFTDRFNNERIDYMNIVSNTIKNYFNELFPMLDLNNDLIIIDNTHHNEGPGVIYDENNNTKNERKNFFEVTGIEDAKRHNNHNRCNDTSTTVSYYPLSKLEHVVLNIEQTLNSNDYKSKLQKIKKDIVNIVKETFENNSVNVYLNTRDNYENNDLYMTLTGSAVESGDEGAVGRGNRSRGVIPFCRNFSMEAACGKNPVYHTGKLFTAIGDMISKEIFDKYNIQNVVYCTSKMGDDINDPWNVSVELNENVDKEILEDINNIVNKYITNHEKVTLEIINEKLKLNSY